MLESVISLAYLPVNQGGAIGNLFYQMEQAGFFSYILPFLVIFALTYGILNNIKIFGENAKGINIILSLAIGFMSLQFGFVSYFFSELFPRMGVFLSIILLALILLGFVDFENRKWVKIVMGFLVFAGIFVVVGQSLGGMFGFGTFGSNRVVWYWIERNLATIFIVVLLVVGSIAIVSSGSKKGDRSLLKSILEEEKRHGR